jgi:hypothetical protein
MLRRGQGSRCVLLALLAWLATQPASGESRSWQRDDFCVASRGAPICFSRQARIRRLVLITTMPAMTPAII